MIDTIIKGDCLEIMPSIPDKSIDMILCDLPYGTTECKWDAVIPLKPLWDEYKRLIRSTGSIVLTASQPFTTILIMGNIEMFKYEWIWTKTRPSGLFHAKNAPLKAHENVLVFSQGSINHPSCTDNRMNYFPQGLIPFGKMTHRPNRDKKASELYGMRPSRKKDFIQEATNYPQSVLMFPNVDNKNSHPTQKPVALFEYLIKTYTNEGDLILDNCIGSGTTAIAARNTGRHFIGIEKEAKYCEIARKRIAEMPTRLDHFV